MRRPFINTSVEPAPRPRSETPAEPGAKPLPKLAGTEPWLSTARVCRYSPTEALLDFSMSSRVMTRTGEAVSVSTRRMLVPVISTRSTACCALPVAGIEISAVDANACPIKMASVFLFITMTFFSRKFLLEYGPLSPRPVSECPRGPVRTREDAMHGCLSPGERLPVHSASANGQGQEPPAQGAVVSSSHAQPPPRNRRLELHKGCASVRRVPNVSRVLFPISNC